MSQTEYAIRPLGASGVTLLQEKRFYFIMSLVCAIAIFAGFAPSYYLKPILQAPPPLSAMTHIHGVVYSAWTLLFVLQAWLIGYERPALHRRLGMLGAVLFGAAIAIGFITAINAGRLGHTPPGMPEALVFMVVPVSAMVSVAILGIVGLWSRAYNRDAHMRFMLATFIGMTPPATHRLILGAGYAEGAMVGAYGIANVLLIIAMIYDLRRNGRVHRAYLWSALAYVAAEAAMYWAFTWPEAWLPIANWLVQV